MNLNVDLYVYVSMEESAEINAIVDMSGSDSEDDDWTDPEEIIQTMENSCKEYIELIDNSLHILQNIRDSCVEDELMLYPLNEEVAKDYDFFGEVGKGVPIMKAVEETLMLALKDLDDSKGEEYTFGERLEVLFEHTILGL